MSALREIAFFFAFLIVCVLSGTSFLYLYGMILEHLGWVLP